MPNYENLKFNEDFYIATSIIVNKFFKYNKLYIIKQIFIGTMPYDHKELCDTFDKLEVIIKQMKK